MAIRIVTLVDIVSGSLGGDKIFRHRSNSIQPCLIGSGKQIFKRRKNKAVEFLSAYTRQPTVSAETLHQPLDCGEGQFIHDVLTA